MKPLLICLALATPLHTTLAAETYPSRPVRLIIPSGAGGVTDILARSIAPKLGDALGQQVVIDNRAGASSIIGLDIVAKSPPNGYTIGASNIAFGANPFLIAKMPFDSEKDLLPVSLTAMVPMVLTVHPSVPSRSVKDLIALAKSKPGAMSFSSAGNASASHLVTELFLDVVGAKMLHVPYKGGGPQVVSTVGGETAVAFIPIPNSLQHIRSGRLIALGLSTLKRDSTLRDVPTIAEAVGIPDFEVSEWHGVVVPAGTPPAVIQLLHREIAKVLARPDIRERLEGAGAQAVGGTPEEMTLYIKREFSRWSKLIKTVGIRVD